jgi:hypothetical protein
MDLTNKVKWLPLFIYIVCIAPCYPLYADEPSGIQNYLSVGVGWEQLSYKEKVPELSLVSSNTEVNNLVLYFDGSKKLNDYFAGFKGILPISYGDAQEEWKRAGQFEQSNSLTNRRTRVDAFFGYILNHLLNPYIGTTWSYSHQERSDFRIADSPELEHVSVTEEVNSFSLLLGLRGMIPISTKWSFAYFVEYLLPYYSKIENNGLDGWGVSDIDGYAYSLTGQVEYLIAERAALMFQIIGGKQYWDGSDWETIGNTRVKWPENETGFVGGYVNFKKYF